MPLVRPSHSWATWLASIETSTRLPRLLCRNVLGLLASTFSLVWTQTCSLSLRKDLVLLLLTASLSSHTAYSQNLAFPFLGTLGNHSLGDSLSWDKLADVISRLLGLPASTRKELGQVPPLSLEVSSALWGGDDCPRVVTNP